MSLITGLFSIATELPVPSTAHSGQRLPRQQKPQRSEGGRTARQDDAELLCGGLQLRRGVSRMELELVDGRHDLGILLHFAQQRRWVCARTDIAETG